MSRSIYDRCEQPVGRWWLALLVGIFAIAVGFIVLINPAESYFAVALWLGVSVFVSGLLTLLLALSTDNYFVHRGWIIFVSVLDIIIGILLMFNILLSETMLPLIFGLWLLYRGISTMMQGLDLKQYGVRDAGWVIFGSAIVIAISLAVLWLPTTVGVGAVVVTVAVAFIIFGVTQISLSSRLCGVHRRARELM